MVKKTHVLPALIIVLIVIAGFFAGFQLSAPASSGHSSTQDSKTSHDAPPKAVQAVKAYAAYQFNLPADQVTVVSSDKQQWDTICLGMKIHDYDCKKSKISGYEVVINADGTQIKYRGADDGSIIRVVK